MLEKEDFIICLPLIILFVFNIFILGFRFGDISHQSDISNKENSCVCCQD